MKFKIEGSVRTDVGRIRTNNEDNYYLCGKFRTNVNLDRAEEKCCMSDRRVLAAVADGMGGEALGEVASLIAAEELHPCTFDQVQTVANESVRRANARICDKIKEENGKQIGSTLVALYIDEGMAQCCYLGDSRCYLLHHGRLSRLTEDHTRAQRMIAMGILTPEQAEKHPSRNRLTRHLGMDELDMVIEPDYVPQIPLCDGDRFLLCSDGLTDMVDDQTIESVLQEESTAAEKTEKLTHLALQNGGRDNVTVLILQVHEKNGILSDQGLLGKLFRKRTSND